jgi:hypothetical protein
MHSSFAGWLNRCAEFWVCVEAYTCTCEKLLTLAGPFSKGNMFPGSAVFGCGYESALGAVDMTMPADVDWSSALLLVLASAHV